MSEKENKYDIDLTGVTEIKKRYTAVEKAQRTLAEAEKVDGVVAQILGDLTDAVEPILQEAQNSNSKMVVREANRIANKLNKILGK